MTANSRFAYVGTYTGGGSAGIYAFSAASTPDDWTLVGTNDKIVNPSFLSLHPNASFFYAVSEVEAVGNQRGGEIVAFAIDPGSGLLRAINRRSTRGTYPCHLCIHPSGKWAFTANYGDGTVSVFNLESDGAIGELTAFVQHPSSKSKHPRQEGPHAHQVLSDPAGKYVFVTDLGLDTIYGYQLDGLGSLVQISEVELPAAVGPRHLVFNPEGEFGYVLNELKGSIAAFKYEASAGTLSHIQTLSILSPSIVAENLSGEIEVHPNGAFLYVTNRGQDNLAVVAIDAATGYLKLVCHRSTGKCPRHFTIDAAGDVLYVANQNSGNISAFRIDSRFARLGEPKIVADVPDPACIVLTEPSR